MILRSVSPTLLLVCLVTVAFLGSVPQSLGQSSGISEYDVKASFLYNFAKFVEWPPSAFSDGKAPIALCIFGDDPFGTVLDDMVRGKTINTPSLTQTSINRQLVTRRVRKPEDLRPCQVVFVSDKENKRLSEILASLKGSSMLVIGDSEDFTDRGGTIQLFLEDSKVHFAINVDALQRAHLGVSANLLALARIVHDGRQPKGE